jgi:hypothetical protein
VYLLDPDPSACQVRAFILVHGDVTYFIMHQLGVIMRAISELEGYVQRKMSEFKRTEGLIKRSTELNHRQIALLGHALRHPDQIYTIKSHSSKQPQRSPSNCTHRPAGTREPRVASPAKGRQGILLSPRREFSQGTRNRLDKLGIEATVPRPRVYPLTATLVALYFAVIVVLQSLFVDSSWAG